LAPHRTSQLNHARVLRSPLRAGRFVQWAQPWALCAVLFAMMMACGDEPPANDSPPASPDPVDAALVAGFAVDTVGVRDLAEGDTLNLDPGLTIIETTVKFPERGEVFAWEFNAETMNPVKLLVVRWKDSRARLELIGESPTVIPERLGLNRIQLPEPIPVRRRDMMGIYMKEAGTVPFRKITSWKTLIMPRPLERPYTRRELFTMYGWRYGVRAFWRKPNDSAEQSIPQ
jgi:hypothetical protein